MTIRKLEYALNPGSLALIGASPRPGSLGNTLMQNLRAGGFEGPIWPVNPRYAEIDGVTCHPDIAALPGTPDLAVIATPPQVVPGLLGDLGARGTGAAVIITAGFGRENGLRQAILDAAQPTCLRIVGPNCLGLFVPRIGLNASFAHLTPADGKLAFLSQSGALVGAVLEWAASRKIGFSYMVSMGDMADVDVGDLLDYLAGDIHTRAILLYLETIPNPRKFMSAARSAARAKPVVIVKSGRHAASAKAAATHTGALAGSDVVADAAFRRAGLLRVHELEELFIAAEGLTRQKPLAGDRLTILTNGGGAGVLAVDRLMDLKGRLAELDDDTIATLDGTLPDTWSRANPIDIIGDAGPERYEAALEAALDAPGSDAVLVMNCPTGLTSPTAAAEAVLKVARERQAGNRPLKPILTNWLGADGAEPARDMFAEAGIPTYETPADSVRSFSYLTGYRKAQMELMRTPPSLPRDFSVDTDAARQAMQPARAANRGLLTEPEAKAVLAAYGIATVATEVAESPEEVRRVAGTLLKTEPAVVIKILSEDITHKTDVGGVRLDIASAEIAGDVAEAMAARIAAAAPEARIQGFTVQPMVNRPGAHELIVGVADDEIFGPVILFGAGGTAVEVMDDKAVGLPPLDLLLARELMAETRIARLLESHRGLAGADLDAVAMTLVRISQLIVDCPEIRELDINPLLADAAGVIALDARIRMDGSGAPAATSRERFAIRPYPSEWETEVELEHDGPLRIRPIRPTDEHYYGTFFDNLEAEDVRLRLFIPQKALSHAFIARFTQIDYARAMAFVAFDRDEETMCGVARFAADPDYTRGEYAVIVRSDLKGKGIGWALMQHLIAYAKAEGLQELHGSVLRENTTMLQMCEELGFEVAADPEDPSVREVVLRLADGG